jgi:predicted nucleic acid-binding protein
VIVVDTSVWVAAIRRPGSDVSTTLKQLLDADEVALPQPVRLELLAGTAKADRSAFRRSFSALPVLIPTADTWQLVEQWIVKAADRGERFALVDLLIGGLADEIDALVWSLNADFVRMARLKLVRTYS